MRPGLLTDPIIWTAGWVILNSSWLVIVVWIVHQLLQRLLKNYGPRSLYWSACACLVALVASCLIMGLLVWSNRPVTEWVVAPQQLLVGGYYDLPEVQSHATYSKMLFVVRPILGLLAGSWTVGLAFVTLLVFVGWIRLKWSVRLSRPFNHEELPEYAALCAQVTPGKQPRILLNDLVLEPATAGWRSPVILIPEGLYPTVSADHLRCVVAHELAHIRRSDYFVNLCQTVCDALLFFHPCARWLSGDVRQLREECCDDIAAEVSGGVRKYGEALLALDNVVSQHDLLQRATGGSLYDRIDRLIRLNKKVRRDSPVRVVVGTIAICTLLLATVASLGNITQYARIDAEIAHRPLGDVVACEFWLATIDKNKDLAKEMEAFLRGCQDERTADREQLTPLVNSLNKGARGSELLLAELQKIENSPATATEGVLSRIPQSMRRWNWTAERIWQLAQNANDPDDRHRWARAALILCCQQSFCWPRLQLILCDAKAGDCLGWSRAKLDHGRRIVAQAAIHDRSRLLLTGYAKALRLRPNVRFPDIANAPHLIHVYLTQAARGTTVAEILEEMAPYTQDEVIGTLSRLIASGRIRPVEVHDPLPATQFWIAPRSSAPSTNADSEY